MNKQGSQNKSVIPGNTAQVRGTDVNGAIRKMKKTLENNNWQKDVSRHEYYEKPSVSKKRSRGAARKRWQKRVAEMTEKGIWSPYVTTRTKYMKSKRKRRKMMERQEVMRRVRRNSQTLGS